MNTKTEYTAPVGWTRGEELKIKRSEPHQSRTPRFLVQQAKLPNITADPVPGSIHIQYFHTYDELSDWLRWWWA